MGEKTPKKMEGYKIFSMFSLYIPLKLLLKILKKRKKEALKIIIKNTHKNLTNTTKFFSLLNFTTTYKI